VAAQPTIAAAEPATAAAEPVVAAAEPAAAAADSTVASAVSAQAEPTPTPPAADASPAAGASPASAPEKPVAHTGPVIMAGVGPASWPIEKLQSDWDRLSIGEKINVAKHGSLAARRMILKLQDRQLHQFVLTNPALTADEVAAMAGMTSLAPELLKQIANKPEWTRHTAVVRNLICHPKLPQDVVTRLLGLLPDLELRKLARTGRVRDSVKRLIIKKVEL
jgi:hypothetical protein